MFPRPGIAVLLVAVATRMSLCLSLFSPLLLVLRWRRHREPIGKKQIWRFGRRALREVPTSPSAVAVSRGWRLGEASHWAVKSIRCRNSENRLSKFYRGEEEWEEEEEEEVGESMWHFFLQTSTTKRCSWHNRESRREDPRTLNNAATKQRNTTVVHYKRKKRQADTSDYTV